MTIQLIYHTPDSMAGGVSPFDTVITDMVEGQELCIACPYLGLSYLQRILERANGWRLLTDVQEWLSSHSLDSRGRIVDFVVANTQRIRHCKDLHAKVLIAGTRALAGSANFTDKGVTGRVEVSVLFDGCEEVDELRAWFDLLWNQTGPVAESDLRSCVATMPPPSPSAGPTALPCVFPSVASELRQLETVGGSSDAEQRLIARLRLAPDRQWAESWLDLAKELVEVTGLTNEDPRLAMSLPQGELIPITVGKRYVLTAFDIKPDGPDQPGHAVVGLILPASMKDRIDKLSMVVGQGSFGAGFTGETESNVPRFVSFSVPSKFDFPPEVLEGWQQAAMAECGHQRVSHVRRYHEPAVYRLVADLAYRRLLLDRVFGARA